MGSPSNRVFAVRFESRSRISLAMQDAFSWLGSGIVKPDTRVFVKPNLTYPMYRPGVTTSPEFMEALTTVLLDSTQRVTFVESDGGTNAWSAWQAMASHGIPELCRRYGVRMLNLTEQTHRVVSCQVDGHEVNVELPAEMLDQSELLITMPVPKVHVMTYLSLGFKNQWGCIPHVKRLQHHPQFDHKVLAINRILRTRIAVYDGTYFLNRTGPMEGDPVSRNLLVVSDGVGAGDLVCSDLMQIPPHKVSHLRLAQQVRMMPRSLEEVTLNCDLALLRGMPFYLRRTTINWITLAAFHSSLLSTLVYSSPLARPIHELLYAIRGRPRDIRPRW